MHPNVAQNAKVTQKDLALTAGTGYRFISELENGKPTCELEKVLRVLHTLGLKVDLAFPPGIEGFNE